MNSREQVIISEVLKMKETDKACLYQIDGDEIWIPKSVHEEFTDGSIAVDLWWVRKESIDL